jgi:hypothetical protein
MNMDNNSNEGNAKVWLVGIVLVVIGVAAWALTNLPEKQANANKTNAETAIEMNKWLIQQPLFEEQTWSDIAIEIATRDQELNRITNERWLDDQFTQAQAQIMTDLLQLVVYIAYGAAALLGLVVGLAAIGRTLMALVRVWQRMLGTVPHDRLYWKRQRELARDLERQRRTQTAAPVPQPMAEKSNGHGQTVKPKRVKLPPI